MRHRLIALSLVGLLAVTGCTKNDNVDLVLAPGSSQVPGASAPGTPTPGASVPTAAGPTATNPGGVAIDRSSVPGAGTPSATVAPGAAGPAATTPANAATGNAANPGAANPPANPGAANPSANAGAGNASAGNAATPAAPGGATANTLAPSSSVEFLFPSTAALAAAWNKARGTIASSPFGNFDTNTVKSGPMSNGAQGFADKSAMPGGVVGGTTEPNQAVSSVIIIIPGSSDVQLAMQSVWAMLDGTRASVPIFQGMESFNAFVANGIPAEGSQAWIDSTGPNYSVVLTVVPGSVIGASTNAIEVSVVPIKDQGMAQGTAQPLRVEVLQLVK